jgi:hypothetical protein
MSSNRSWLDWKQHGHQDTKLKKISDLVLRSKILYHQI